MDPEHDRRVSEHVLRMHRYRNPGEQDGEGIVCNHLSIDPHTCASIFIAMTLGGVSDTLGTGDMDVDEKDQEDTPIFDKHNDILHGHAKTLASHLICIVLLLP